MHRERRKDLVEVHASPVVGIDESRLDEPVAPDNERRWNGQGPGIAVGKGRDVPAGGLHMVSLLVANIEGEVKEQGIAIVHVRQDRKRRLRDILQLGIELFDLRRDDNEFGVERSHRVVNLGQSRRGDAAIWTPMPAVEGDRDRASGGELAKRHEAPTLIRQKELGHRLARLRGFSTGARSPQSVDHARDDGGELWTGAFDIFGKCGEAFGERRVHRAAALRALLENLRQILVGHVTSASARPAS